MGAQACSVHLYSLASKVRRKLHLQAVGPMHAAWRRKDRTTPHASAVQFFILLQLGAQHMLETRMSIFLGFCV